VFSSTQYFTLYSEVTGIPISKTKSSSAARKEK